ncbi:alcohol dehydrogenase catalytic domain-containing protein [Bifidobacterium pseudolongum]|uniref:alcohol dehydrogenase catalytic domain-containing protein n=1 Tax=Bifidobacterium pseudolongum TaxID=1694 RepID=UPI0035312C72
MIVCGEVKLIVPYRMPLTMGNEFVGVVERTGTQVTRFSAGERVYGRMPLDSIGAFAQFVSIPQSALEATPEYMNDEEAACVPLTALTAWHKRTSSCMWPKAAVCSSPGRREAWARWRCNRTRLGPRGVCQWWSFRPAAHARHGRDDLRRLQDSGLRHDAVGHGLCARYGG